MKILLNIFVSIGLLLGGTTAISLPIYAAFDPNADICRSTPQATVCQDSANNTGNPIAGKDGIITKAVQVIALLTGIAAVIAIIIGGLRFVLSGGDSEKVATAKSTILYAAIGLVIAALAQVIVVFVLSRL